jgi:hypothetical protein
MKTDPGSHTGLSADIARAAAQRARATADGITADPTQDAVSPGQGG